MRYTNTPEPEGWDEIYEEATHRAAGLGVALRGFLMVLLILGAVVVALNVNAVAGVATALVAGLAIVGLMAATGDEGQP